VLAAAAFLVTIAALPTRASAQNASRKFGRGLAGMTTSILDVPGNVVAETETRGAATGVPLGFVEGLGMMMLRVPVGVYELVTAPFPAPSHYDPVLQPEYPWSYFEERRPRPALSRNDVGYDDHRFAAPRPW
jgi:putative exosortase-associated protein (TIGR04073 family)